MSDSFDHTNNPLRVALRSTNDPVKEIAKKTKVSSLTIASIKNPVDSKNNLTPQSLDSWSARRTRGFIGSVIKLCGYFGLEEFEVLSSYKLPNMDEERLHSEIILIKHEEKKEPDFHAGVIKWLPFVKEGEEVTDSWAGKFVDRILKSIDPNREIEILDKGQNYLKTLNELADGSGNKKPLDLVFGLYNDPSRSRRHISFVQLPGIRVKLDIASPTPISFKDLQLRRKPNNREVQFMCLKHEVAHSFLISDCHYPKTKIRVYDELDLDLIAREYVAYNSESEIRAVSPIYCFVADAYTVDQVKFKIRQIDPSVLGESNVIAPNTENKPSTEEDDLYTPSYAIGFSRSPFSERVTSDLLRYEISHGLFGNGMAQTALAYIELLYWDIETVDGLVIEFAHDLGSRKWEKFLRVCEDLLVKKDLTDEIRTRIIKTLNNSRN